MKNYTLKTFSLFQFLVSKQIMGRWRHHCADHNNNGDQNELHTSHCGLSRHSIEISKQFQFAHISRFSVKKCIKAQSQFINPSKKIIGRGSVLTNGEMSNMYCIQRVDQDEAPVTVLDHQTSRKFEPLIVGHYNMC